MTVEGQGWTTTGRDSVVWKGQRITGVRVRTWKGHPSCVFFSLCICKGHNMAPKCADLLRVLGTVLWDDRHSTDTPTQVYKECLSYIILPPECPLIRHCRPLSRSSECYTFTLSLFFSYSNFVIIKDVLRYSEGEACSYDWNVYAFYLQAPRRGTEPCPLYSGSVRSSLLSFFLSL